MDLPMTTEAAPAGPTDPAAQIDKQPLERISRDGVEYIVLGTAHVSRASAEAARQLASELDIDAIAVELDAGRHQALTDADTGTVLYSPSAFRFSSSGSINSPTLFSAVNIQNTSSTQTANVDIEFYNRDNGNLDLTLQASIPPLSAIGANTLNGGDFPASAFAALEPSPGVFDWDGAIKIISTNGVALAGTGVTNWGTDQKGGMSALASANTAANKLFLPAQYRLDFGSGWAQWSSINLQNVGTDPIDRDDLRIEYIDTNGNTIATFTGTTGTFAFRISLITGVFQRGSATPFTSVR